jgi:hypothetical protein
MLAKDYNNNFPEIPPMTHSHIYGVATGDEPPLFAMQEGKMLKFYTHARQKL